MFRTTILADVGVWGFATFAQARVDPPAGGGMKRDLDCINNSCKRRICDPQNLWFFQL